MRAPSAKHRISAGQETTARRPPTLKTLYRRAARRLHPDLAADERSRRAREQEMMAANQAYAHGDRAELERLLLAAGEDPAVVAYERDVVDHALEVSNPGPYHDVVVDELSVMAQSCLHLAVMMSDPDRYLPVSWGRRPSPPAPYQPTLS